MIEGIFKLALPVLGGLFIMTLIGLLMGYPTMLIMNYLFSPSLLMTVFGVSHLGFWKAFWFNIFGGLMMANSIWHLLVVAVLALRTRLA